MSFETSVEYFRIKEFASAAGIELDEIAAMRLTQGNYEIVAQCFESLAARSKSSGCFRFESFFEICKRTCESVDQLDPSEFELASETIKEAVWVARFALLQLGTLNAEKGDEPVLDAPEGSFDEIVGRLDNKAKRPMSGDSSGNSERELKAADEMEKIAQFAELEAKAINPSQQTQGLEQENVTAKQTVKNTNQSNVDLSIENPDEIDAEIMATAFEEIKEEDESQSSSQDFSEDSSQTLAESEQNWDKLTELTSLSVRQPAASSGPDTVPLEELLKSISTLAEKSQMDKAWRELSYTIARAAQSVHSMPFGEICHPFLTDTPHSRVEEFAVSPIKNLLIQWSADIDPAQSTATLRQVGGVLWLELRTPEAGALEPESSTGHDVQNVSLFESYLSTEGYYIRRARLDLILPTFKAYEVKSCGKSFLIPVGDVEAVMETLPTTGKIILFEDFLELPSEWSRKDPAGALLIRCRGRSLVLGVSAIVGPQTYFAKNLYDPGVDYRGMVGVAKLPEGGKAAVVDLYPWYERYLEREAEFEKLRKGQAQKTSGKYVVFKVEGKRYAFEMEVVKAVGKVDSESLLVGMVESNQGAFYLRDIREVLGVEGPCGGLYVAVGKGEGTLAWGVDSVEPVQKWDDVKRTQKGLILGHLPIPQGQSHLHPVYLLNPDYFMPKRKSLSKDKLAA